MFVGNTSLLKGFILGLLPDVHRAEDVLQEVFLTVTQKASSTSRRSRSCR
jgi:DNA-directed RNA polymerase specialized sigma24 family protein